MEDFIIGFSICFVMANASFLFVSRIVEFLINIRRNKATDNRFDSDIKEILIAQQLSETCKQKQAEIDNLKKENNIYRIKVQQLEENNEHMEMKLKGRQE